MQITETLNNQQRLMSLAHKEALQQTFPIFNDLTTEGYEVEFYYVGGFGGLTIVPSVKRIRVKANQAILSDPESCSELACKVRKSFESRLTNPKFLAGKKISTHFRKPQTWGKK